MHSLISRTKRLLPYVVAVIALIWMVMHLRAGHWATIAALCVMIVVHELGHWVVARSMGVDVPVFSIGFGSVPRIPLGTYWGTRFQITPWLAGGYVKFNPNDPSFQAKAAWKRASVLLGGVVMNVLLSLATVFGLCLARHFGPLAAFNRALSVVAELGVDMGKAILMMAHILPVPHGVPPGAAAVHGIVSAVQMGQTAFSNGLFSFGWLVALLSMNLAVLNVLPIPNLDGGHLLFLAWEKIVGKPVPVAIQQKISIVFVGLLVAVMGYALFNDLAHPVL